MKTIEEKLQSITHSTVWKFAKQEVDFDKVFSATRVFKDFKNDKGDTNLEDYFIQHHAGRNVETTRHRILLIAQIYGLITKTHFYSRGAKYEDESCTAVFEKLSKLDLGSREYNELKTEQILKVKIRAITDTTQDVFDWNLLAVVYSFKVLKELKDRTGKTSVQINKFITYVMTCASFTELEESVGFLQMDADEYDGIDALKDSSRFLAVLKNIGLFNINEHDQTISINEMFESYFDQKLMTSGKTLIDIEGTLKMEESYATFLQNPQYFGINLIDDPIVEKDYEPMEPGDPSVEDHLQTPQYFGINLVENPIVEKDYEPMEPGDPSVEDQDEILKSVLGEEMHSYSEDIDSIIEKIALRSSQEPVETRVKIARTLVRNAKIAKLVKERDKYTCQICGEVGFLMENGDRYAEAHHNDELSKSRIDNPKRMITVCPTCHRVIHYGTEEELNLRKSIDRKT